MKAVVVKLNNLKSIIRFKSEENLKKFYNKVINKGFEAYIIDCNEATPPPKDYKVERNSFLWCPYCAEKRKFKKSNDYRKCEICGISDSDFHVRVYNKLDSRGGKD